MSDLAFIERAIMFMSEQDKEYLMELLNYCDEESDLLEPACIIYLYSKNLKMSSSLFSQEETLLMHNYIESAIMNGLISQDFYQNIANIFTHHDYAKQISFRDQQTVLGSQSISTQDTASLLQDHLEDETLEWQREEQNQEEEEEIDESRQMSRPLNYFDPVLFLNTRSIRDSNNAEKEKEDGQKCHYFNSH